MNIVILGAAGFIGTNLALKLSQDENNFITVVDETLEYFNACLNRDTYIYDEVGNVIANVPWLEFIKIYAL